MQKGFATLEVVLVILIIAVLASCAVPNAVRVLDSVSLDCETKRLYTELRHIQSYDRMKQMDDKHFKDNADTLPLNFEIKETYYLLKQTSPEKIYKQHFLPKGFKLSYPAAMDFSYIKFDDMGKPQASNNTTLNGHMILTSRLGKQRYFAFDSVGRFRGSRTKPQ